VPAAFPKAVLFDLLTALLDSWTSWNHAAGSEQTGRAWRAAYLRLTYGCGRYIAYEQLVREAAAQVGLPESAALALDAHWLTLKPWPGAIDACERSNRTASSRSSPIAPRAWARGRPT
jgi:hypothetical protein